jgi:hypothetical protein
MSPLPATLAASLLLLSVVNLACTKQPPPPVSTAAPAEHAAPSPVGTTQSILEKTFTLKAPVTFPFEIPAHAVRPHLHGIFESFVGQVHGASDETANIDFLILNEEQNAAFASNRPSEVLFSVDASHNQAVNFDLPASLNHPAKYYLVFRNPEDSRSSKVVEANFRIDF